MIETEGLVGRHVGDGVVAFFLAETAGPESAAARNCITAARSLRAAVGEVADRSDLEPGEIVPRFGLHWSSRLYVGSITTAGRSEVTTLGAEANETARIEACATGGLALVSKNLIERLQPEDAAAPTGFRDPASSRARRLGTRARGTDLDPKRSPRAA